MSAPENLLDVALELHAAGLCVLPAAEDQSKRPAIDWKAYQQDRPDEAQLRAWFGDGRRHGLGLVCGAVSGGLEVTELEARAVEAGAFVELSELASNSGLADLWHRTLNGWLVSSPSGGLHLLYRLAGAPVGGNTKLAATPDHVTLAETRGEGGWIIAAPSGGLVHPSGGSWRTVAGGPSTMATLTPDEREALHVLVAQLDQRPAPLPPSPFTAHSSGSGEEGISPGDDYTARTTWPELLEPAGWRQVFTRGPVTYWRRPGKRDGISATTGYQGDWLYVFSSSTEFEQLRTFTRFGAYAVLHHGGDYKAAARQLAEDGYGKRPTRDAAEQTAAEPQPQAPPPPAPRSLDEVHAVFTRWLGGGYDLQALDVVLAAAAVERLDGDPVWLLMISGSGMAKTETVTPLIGAGAHVTSSISSAGALLSATSKKERTTDATGGLLRKIGPRGTLVIKDFTTILSMSRDPRAEVLAALREVYDGRWERNVGTDGGKTLTWEGRITLIGAATTAYDSAHGVIASMGDRFALVRVDSNTGRRDAGRQSLANTGHEVQMRADLAEAVGGGLAALDPTRVKLTHDDEEELLNLADLVTLSRTAVEKDSRGDIIDAHAPEAPTRFAKMLGQIVRGGQALGIHRDDALALARRVARDSMPPLRLAVLADVHSTPNSTTAQVRARLQKPRTTIDRALQELHVLGLLRQHELPGTRNWVYELSDAVDPPTLLALVTRKVSTPGVREQEEGSRGVPKAHPPTDIPGDRAPALQLVAP